MNIPESDKKSPKLTRLNKQSNECVEMTKIPTFVHQIAVFCFVFVLFFFSVFSEFSLSVFLTHNQRPPPPMWKEGGPIVL